MSDDELITLAKKKSEAPPPRRKPKKIVIPRREPSTVVPPRVPVYITPDKTVCVECPCFPPEDPYAKNKKLNPCQKSPRTLYELSAEVVDRLGFPPALDWSENEVADWLATEVGFPEYKDCILDNHINGSRLIMLEDSFALTEINVKNFDHIKVITSKVRELYKMEFVRFCRSVGLVPRRPLTHCTWFRSRTGPSWGIRQNWTRSDVLRWMKIVGPAPVYMDHWDLVWHQENSESKKVYQSPSNTSGWSTGRSRRNRRRPRRPKRRSRGSCRRRSV
ncbi:uncharacterized protein LOC116778360 isoform X2 [Danaus plexippus]|uniref:uncharacterized protein LOC116778360 isoform X2 n=1 Tax=Danaus plexippus TaxID=13037 RepID=UPI002AAF8EB0|nr:uncharacterized protein LOC116778360 isoform X2 [Danaus plexippus]